MEITLIDILGFCGATLTTGSFLPQAYKVIRTHETEAISLWMYILFTVGVAFWFAFGVLLNSWPVILSNAITFVLTLTILIIKLRQKKG